MPAFHSGNAPRPSKPISADSLAQRLNHITGLAGWELGDAYYCKLASEAAAESVAEMLDDRNILCDVTGSTVSVALSERTKILAARISSRDR